MSDEKQKTTVDAKEKQKAHVDTDITIEEVQLGLWNVKVAHPPTLSIRRLLDNIQSAYPLYSRLFLDIYRISPRLFTFFLMCQAWRGVEDAILMHLSSSLLSRVEQGLITGNPDKLGILWLIVLQISCSLFVAYIGWHGDVTLSVLRSRVTSYFNLYLMKAKLRVDIPTSQEIASTPEGSASDAMQSLEDIIRFLTELLTVFSQLALIVHLSRNTGGPIFALLCISKPITAAMFAKDIWDKVCFAFIENKDHQRRRALEAFSDGTYRQDIVANNLNEWIIHEYEKAHAHMGVYNDEPPYHSYGRRPSPTFDMFTKLLDDLPMIYCALNVIMNPSKFSVASLATLQRSSTTLRWSLEMIFRTNEQFRRSLKSIRSLYDAQNVVNTLKDGTIPYPPPPTEKRDESSDKGMSFDLKDVSFSYPGSQKTTPSLHDISLKVNAGQLVVVVGENGSGKSTLVRLLSRLYDPTSGEIMIDGHPSIDYRTEDIHRATAILSQDNLIYPLSLEENIGLGYPEFSSDTTMIREAAEEGGSLAFIEKLKNGLQTTLTPFIQTFQFNLYGNKTHPLYVELEKLNKEIDISGGEKQRIVASRSFMRFKSGKVKFVAVDEPSSALDAEGELQLFKRLLDVREGKTMVFVTHRFGHLTNHADMIICMKDGSIVETGSHEELISAKGEYAKLYNIQASAFIQNGDSKAESIASEVIIM